MLFTQTVDKVLLLQGFVYNLKSAAADCFFYLYTLFCIWIDSYFYCPIYFSHLIPTCLQMISIAVSEQYVLFHYNESIKKSIVNGLGISILSARSVPDLEKTKQILLFPLEESAHKRNFYIVYNKNRILKPQVRQFIHYVKNFYTEN